MRPHVNSQHILHRRYEGAIRLRRDDPALFAVGLDNVFFSTRPIVLSLARSTILSSTTFSSNSRKLQRAKPSGGWEHASAISLASFSPSKIRATGGLSRTLRLSTASETSAFNKISAFVSRLAGIFPLVLSASSRSRSSALSRTTYLFTATSRAAILASVPKGAEGSESIKGCELVDAAD